MSQAELLALVVAAFDDLQIPYMLVGSHAASFYGEPRSTHDIDIVIELAPEKISKLVAKFDRQRYYFSEAAIREGRMANLIDLETGDKVDCFLLDDTVTSQRAFSRRSKQRIIGIAKEISIASAEDTILSKLKWSQLSGGSTRQQVDVREILRIQRGKLDWSYLQKQAQEMQVSLELQEQLNALGMNVDKEHD